MTKVVTELEQYGAVECRALEFEAKGNSVFVSVLDGATSTRTLEFDRTVLTQAMTEELAVSVM